MVNALVCNSAQSLDVYICDREGNRVDAVTVFNMRLSPGKPHGRVILDLLMLGRAGKAGGRVVMGGELGMGCRKLARLMRSALVRMEHQGWLDVSVRLAVPHARSWRRGNAAMGINLVLMQEDNTVHNSHDDLEGHMCVLATWKAAESPVASRGGALRWSQALQLPCLRCLQMV